MIIKDLEEKIAVAIEGVDPYMQMEALLNVKSQLDNRIIVSMQKQMSEFQVKAIMVSVNNMIEGK